MRIPLIFASVVLVSAMLMTGCSPDKVKDLGEPPSASFTMTPVPGRTNTYALASTSTGGWGYAWDKGTGTFVKGNPTDTVYFPTMGNKSVKLRVFGHGGSATAEQTVQILADDLMNIPEFVMLTSHGWKLDPADGANAIIVGTEGNPGQYFPGGGLDGCQKDDVYTFSPNLTVSYNAAGSTFNAGNIAPNYSCGADRSYNAVAFTFAPGVPSGSAGIAQIAINSPVPDKFIGVTDVSSNNYRIISISATTMVLRSGTAAETVHQFKFVAQ